MFIPFCTRTVLTSYSRNTHIFIMMRKNIKSWFRRNVELRKYNNIVEASSWARIVLKFSGTVIWDVKTPSGNLATAKFSPFGFATFVIMSSIYLFCSYIVISEDQTILRLLYSTKLGRYGDDFERIFSSVFVIITLLLNPFRVTCNCGIMQKFINIDVEIEKAGHIIDHNKLAHTSLSLALSQVVVYVVRVACVYVVLESSAAMPVAKMFHVCLTDSLALITAALFCYSLSILIDRFKWINKTLCEIKERKSWEYKVFVRGKVPPHMVKVVELQDRQVCEKIKTCAKIYSMLYDASQSLSSIYGLSLLCLMMYSFDYIILYLFYFMEATAIGLFHDSKRYFNFLLYTFWEICISFVIVFLVVMFSETCMRHAKKTSVILHEIINEDFGKDVNDEALKFSLQLIHEAPVFTVCGLFTLEYSYLQQAARSVSTYLVILLQFVTEK